MAEVSDPVAIHAIELLLGKSLGVDTQMMDGLRAIGNNEARDLLRAYIQQAPSPEDAAYARSAIAQIDKRNNRRQ